MEWPAFQLIHADRERKRCVGQNCDRERESASHDNVCVYPRDDVNTPHESTRLLGRGGRAAQFSCSRSSLVTRRNSAQVVLLCGECSTAASTYDLSLFLPVSPSPSFLICPRFSCVFYPLVSLFFWLSFIRHGFHPFSLLPRFPPLHRSILSFLSFSSPTILPSRLTD